LESQRKLEGLRVGCPQLFTEDLVPKVPASVWTRAITVMTLTVAVVLLVLGLRRLLFADTR
jgi:hypothetical protein